MSGDVALLMQRVQSAGSTRQSHQATALRTAWNPLYPARTNAEVKRPMIAYDPTTCDSENGFSSVLVDSELGAGGVAPVDLSDTGSA